MVYVAFTWVLGPSSGPHATEVRFLTELFPQVRQLIYKKEKEKKKIASIYLCWGCLSGIHVGVRGQLSRADYLLLLWGSQRLN